MSEVLWSVFLGGFTAVSFALVNDGEPFWAVSAIFFVVSQIKLSAALLMKALKGERSERL